MILLTDNRINKYDLLILIVKDDPNLNTILALRKLEKKTSSPQKK